MTRGARPGVAGAGARGWRRAAEGARTMVSAGRGTVVMWRVQGGRGGVRTMASAERRGGSADPPSPEAAAAAWAGRCRLSPSFLRKTRVWEGY